MTDDRDDEIGKRYRELAREEPPRVLDEAILAAARRELETRPAPLVAPTGRRRWMFPVAAAAVIVLSAVVTLHVQREQPDLETASAPPPEVSAAKPTEQVPGAPAPAQTQQPPAPPGEKTAETRVAKRKDEVQPQRAQTRSAGPSAAREAAKESAPALSDRAQPKVEEPPRFAPDPSPAPQAESKPVPVPQAAEPRAPAAAAAAPRAEPERDALEMRREGLSRRADSMMAKSQAIPEPPERMLERIATLRREGRHKEADDLYAEFRKRFPDYRIPEAVRGQVVPR